MAKQLWELKSMIEDAEILLADAADDANHWATADDEPGDVWPAMGAIRDRLRAMRDEVRIILAPVMDQIKAESDELDDMADRAEAMGYGVIPR